MSDGAEARGEIGPMRLKPPRWTHGLMALAGVALAIGPTLAALWPS